MNVLDSLRRSRPLALITLFALFVPLVPRPAFAQASDAPPPPSPAPANIQEGMTDLGVAETAPVAQSGALARANVDPATGTLHASIPFAMPHARGGVQPSLSLNYSSAGGYGVGGHGWSLNLPTIERHNRSGLPQYEDTPDAGTDGAAPDWTTVDQFTFGGENLVPVSTSAVPAEPFPAWATKGWVYYQLETERGANLRFFRSPDSATWVVQEPSGATMELGVPRDNSADRGGIDVDGLTGGIFRWNLVRHYDAQRLPGSEPPFPANIVEYVWAPQTGISPFSEPIGPSNIGYLSDIYDTPPVGQIPPLTSWFAHHTRLRYKPGPTATVMNASPVARARPGFLLVGVDVTSQSFASATPRAQVRRYFITYEPYSTDSQPITVQIEGSCGEVTPNPGVSGIPFEDGSGALAAEATPGTNCPALPATDLTYSSPAANAQEPPTPTFHQLPTDVAWNETPPMIFDVNSDGMPDLVAGHLNAPAFVYLNGVGESLDDWRLSAISMSAANPGDSLSQMSSFNGAFIGGSWLNDAHIDGALLQTGSEGPQLDVYSPVVTGTGDFDWGTATVYSVPGIATGWSSCCNPVSTAHRVFEFYSCVDEWLVGEEAKFASVDLDGDGFQDLLTSALYFVQPQPPASEFQIDVTNQYSSYFMNAHFTAVSAGGTVSPFALGGPQSGSIGAVDSIEYSPIETPNVCIGGLTTSSQIFDIKNTATLGDLNGDGLPDWIKEYSDHLDIWFGHGDGTFGTKNSIASLSAACSCAEATPVTNATVGGVGAYFHDVTGDGLDDMLVPNATGFLLYTNAGGGPAATPIVVDVASRFGWPASLGALAFADMDGSGVDDVVVLGGGGRAGYVDIAGGVRPGLLQMISTSPGVSTTIAYSDFSSLLRSGAATGAPIPQPIHVVTSITIADAPPGQLPPSDEPAIATNYSYGGAVFDARDRQFVGFTSVTVTTLGDASDPESTVTTTYFQGACGGTNTTPCPTTNDYALRSLRGLPTVVTTTSASATLSTVHHSYMEIAIYAGLDRRSVHRVYETATDTYLSDPSVVSTSTTATTLVDIDEGGRIVDGTFFTSTGALHLQVQYTLTPAWQPTVGLRLMMTDLGEVDSGGNSLDGPIQSIIDMAVIGEDTTDRWTWRVMSESTTGTDPLLLSPVSRFVMFTYDSRGNDLEATSPLVGTLALQRSVSAPPPGASTDGTVTLHAINYDPAGTGNAITITGPDSRCIGFSYDGAYAQLVTDQAVFTSGCGGAAIHTSTPAYVRGLERPLATVGPNGATTSFTYEAFGRPSTIATPDPSIAGGTLAAVSFTYRDSTSPRSVTAGVSSSADLLAPSFTTYFDGFGRVWARETPGAAVGQWIQSGHARYGAKGSVIAAVVPAVVGGVTPVLAGAESRSVRYDGFGRVVAAADIDGTQTLQRVYHAMSMQSWDAEQLNAKGAHAGRSTSVTFDGHGRETAVTATGNGGSAGMTFTYMPTGEVRGVGRAGSDSAANVASSRWMTYDSLGRLVNNVEPNTSANLGSPVASVKAWTYAYDDAGDLVGTADARGCGENIAYDGAGRLLSEDYVPCETSQPAYSAPSATGGLEVSYVYASPTPSGLVSGLVTDVYDRAVHTHTSYDFKGRPTSTERNLVSPTTPGEYTPHTYHVSFAYDWWDRVVSQTTGADVAGLQGDEGHLLGSTAEVDATYGGQGNITGVAGSYGQIVSGSQIDADGLLRELDWADAAKTVTSLNYDSRRRLQERKISRSPAALWSGHASGGTYVPPSTNPSTLQTVLDDEIIPNNVGYDRVGNPLVIQDNRLVAEWPAFAGPVTRTMGYDDFYRLTNVAYDYPGGNTTYAQPGPIATSTSSPAPAALATKRIGSESFRYDPLGNMTESEDDGPVFYDRSLGTVTMGGVATDQLVTADTAGGGKLYAYYDASGNLVGLDVYRAETCVGGSCTQIYRYDWDEVGRLAHATRYDIATPAITTAEFAPVGAEPATPDLNCAVATARGRLVAGCPSPVPPSRFIDAGAPAASPGGWQKEDPYAYPTVPEGVSWGADMDVLYDAGGTRVLRTYNHAGTLILGSESPPWSEYSAEIFASLRLNHTTFGVETVGDFDRSEATEAAYLMIGGMSLGRVVYSGTDPVTQASGVTHMFLEMGDSLGSTAVTVDRATGELVERATYTAYGQVETDYRPERWGEFREDYQFTGKETDSEFGLEYFGARYYAPNLGRWISPDPATIHGLQSDMNPYAYVRGRPTRFVDRIGLEDDDPQPDPSCDDSSCDNEGNSSGGGVVGGGGSGGASVGGGGGGGGRGGGGGNNGPGVPALPPSATAVGAPRASGLPALAISRQATQWVWREGIDFGATAANDVVIAAGEIAESAAVSIGGVETAAGCVGAVCALGGVVGLAVMLMNFGPPVDEGAHEGGARLAAAGGGGKEPPDEPPTELARRLGAEGEARVRSVSDIGPKSPIDVGGKTYVPDGINSQVLSEVKNVSYQSFTDQLRAFATYASQNGLRFDLWIRAGTVLSERLQQQVLNGAVELRYIP